MVSRSFKLRKKWKSQKGAPTPTPKKTQQLGQNDQSKDNTNKGRQSVTKYPYPPYPPELNTGAATYSKFGNKKEQIVSVMDKLPRTSISDEITDVSIPPILFALDHSMPNRLRFPGECSHLPTREVLRQTRFPSAKPPSSLPYLMQLSDPFHAPHPPPTINPS